MRRFAGLFMAACMTVAVPAATVFADEVATESVESSAETEVETNAEEVPSTEGAPTQSAESDSTQELTIAQSLDGVTFPADTEQITYTYHGNVCTAAKTATGLYLLPVVQDDGSIVWYVYNEDIDQAIPYVNFTSIDTSYAIILPSEDITVPSGYEPVNIDMNGNGRLVPAWFSSAAGDPNMYLVYAMASDGTTGLYRLDGTTGTCMRYVADQDVDLQASASSLSDELASLQDSYNSMSSQDSEEISKLNSSASLQQQNYNNLKENVKKYGLIGVAALGVVTLLMLIFFIRMISKSSKLKKAKKKVAELESAAKTRAQQARPRNAEPSTRRVRRDDMGDTRMTEGREEGTSRVRRVPKNSDRGFEKSTTTSKVTRVSREDSDERTGARPVRQQPARQAQSTSGQARPARKPETAAPRQQRPVRPTNGQTRTQRPVKPTTSRPSGETKIFDKAPAGGVSDLDGLDDVKSTSPVKTSVDAADIDKISEQLNSLHAAESSPIEDDFIEVESAEPEDFYTEDADDDDDFTLTDFKDI